jgi:hypothetical protein
VTPLSEAVHQQPERLLDQMSDFKHLKLAGEGAQQHELLIKARAERAGISLVEEEATLDETLNDDERLWLLAGPISALATDIAALAYLSYQGGEAIGPERLQAIYVRPSDAELHTQER